MFIRSRLLRVNGLREPNFHNLSPSNLFGISFCRFFFVSNTGNTNKKESPSEEKSIIAKEKRREYQRKYQQKPEIKKKKREYNQKPEIEEKLREYNREYKQKPEIKEKIREYNREYKQKPEIKEKIREYYREYNQKPEIKEKLREYNREYKQKPEIKEKLREYNREYYQRPEIKEKIREYNQKPEIKEKNFKKYFESKLKINPHYKPRMKIPYDLKDKDSLKCFLEKLAESLKIRELSDWYRVSTIQIRMNEGSAVLYHYGSIGFALKFAYSEYEWDMSRFPLRNKCAAQRWLCVLLQILLSENVAVVENWRDDPSLRREGIKFPSSYDIFVKELGLALEYQGEQHYRDIPGSGFMPVSERQKMDADKMASSRKHGITLVCIPYWWDETIDSLSSTLHQHMPKIFPKTDSPPIPAELPLTYKSNRYKPVLSNKNIMKGYDLEDCEEKINVKGWFMSEKMDGIRAYWDGKTFWSKNAKIINVPESFKKLPSFPLDGELWAGYGENASYLTLLKKSCGAYRKTKLDWTKVVFCVFDAPDVKGTYDKRHLFLENNFTQYCTSNISLIPMQKCDGKDHLEKHLVEIVQKGGEGIMIYDPKLPYQPGRCKNVLKVKKYFEAEVTFLGRNENSYNFNCMQDNGSVSSLGVTSFYYVHAPEVGTKIPVKHQGFFANSQQFKYPVLIEPKPTTLKRKRKTNNDNNNNVE